MNAPRTLGPVTLLIALVMLAACGGGGSAGQPAAETGPRIVQFTPERATYFVGERARLTAVYSGGTGRIEPGSIPVASGQTVETPVLQARANFRLIVDDGTTRVFRDATIDVGYRERLRTLAMPFARSEHATAILGDGGILVIGGEDGAELSPTVWRFHPGTETFTRYAMLSTGRAGHVAVALGDGNVLVYGGGRALSESPVAEIIDTTTGTARPTRGPQPVVSRTHAAALLLGDGRVLIVGGSVAGGTVSGAEIFDPATETFTPIATAVPSRRYSHTVTRLADGRVLVYGGFGAGPDGAPLPPEVFDPATNRFTALTAPETNVRANHAAVGVADGSVWIVGGEDIDGRALASAWRFDPATNAFTRLPDLTTGRNFARAAGLTDGRVFVAGGDAQGDPFGSDSVELLSANGLRRGGPTLASPRVLHTVTPIVTAGKLLVIGGLGPDRGVLATAEIFE
jgi:hypothetical protein